MGIQPEEHAVIDRCLNPFRGILMQDEFLRAHRQDNVLILPAFGLCFDNAWELKENNVYLTLEPISPEAKKEAAEFAPWRNRRLKEGDPVDTTKDPKARETFSEL